MNKLAPLIGREIQLRNSRSRLEAFEFGSSPRTRMRRSSSSNITPTTGSKPSRRALDTRCRCSSTWCPNPCRCCTTIQTRRPADLRRVVAVPDYPGSAWPATDEIYNDFIICDMMTKTATGAMKAEESVKSLSRSALRPISFAATSSGARSWPARRSPASRWRSPITSSSIASSPASPAALSNRLRPPPLITAPAIVQPSGAYRVLICDASDSKPNTEHSRSIWPSRQPLAFAPSSGDREGPA
jgi:hypothetical protein